jgi:hypothetical protein
VLFYVPDGKIKAPSGAKDPNDAKAVGDEAKAVGDEFLTAAAHDSKTRKQCDAKESASTGSNRMLAAHFIASKSTK